MQKSQVTEKSCEDSSSSLASFLKPYLCSCQLMSVIVVAIAFPFIVSSLWSLTKLYSLLFIISSCFSLSFPLSLFDFSLFPLKYLDAFQVLIPLSGSSFHLPVSLPTHAEKLTLFISVADGRLPK